MPFPTLPPAATGRSITTVISAADDPYLIWFFNNAKLTGETVSAFNTRIMMKQAKVFYADRQVSDAISIARTNNETLRDEAEIFKTS